MNEQERLSLIARMDSEPPIVVRPSVAKDIGLNEAIVLQQLMYWLTRSGNVRDGKTWVYKTYDEWTTEFPFWSNATVRRTIKSLKDMGLVETTDEYNKMKIDNTLWYTIPGWGVSRPSAQNEQTHLLKMSKPITRDYTETTVVGSPLPTNGKRQRHQTPEHIIVAKSAGLDAKQMRELVDAVLDVTGKRAVADGDDTFADRALAGAQECAAGLVSRGVTTQDGVRKLADAFHSTYGFKNPPAFSQLVSAVGLVPQKSNVDATQYEFEEWGL